MSTLATIQSSHVVKNSRSVINNNFTTLNNAIGQKTVTTVSQFTGADYVCSSLNSATQIQAAITAIHEVGGGDLWIRWEDTDYILDAPLTLYSNVRIFSHKAVLKLANGVNGNIFLANAAGGYESITLSGLVLDGNASNQSGAGTGSSLVYIDGKDTLLKDIVIEHCTVKNSYKHAIFVTGDNTSNRYPKWIQNNYIENHGPSAIGYGIYVDYCPNTEIRGNTIKTSNGNDAIEMGHMGEIRTVGNYVFDGQIQFPFASNSIIANNIVKANTIQNDANEADNMIIVGNQVLNATPGSGFAGIRVFGENAIIQGNEVKVTTNSGIAVYGDGATINGNKVNGTNKDSGGSNGIYADRSNNTTIFGNSISNFNRAVQLVYDNNIVDANMVLACNTGVDFSDSSSSGHVMTGTLVVNNNLAGATTKINLHNQTSNYTVRNNIGYVTENSGTATVASGSTSVVVSHGLSVTPTADDISVTPTNSLGSAAKYWSSNLTSTQFTINVDVNPGATTATFAWKAIAL